MAESNESKDNEDIFQLFDRSSIYAKEQAYKREAIVSEVNEEAIRDFDEDDNYPGDNPEDNSKERRNDKQCLPMDVDLRAMLAKERRSKKILMLICIILSTLCTVLLVNPSNDMFIFDSGERDYSATVTAQNEILRDDVVQTVEMEQEKNPQTEEISLNTDQTQPVPIANVHPMEFEVINDSDANEIPLGANEISLEASDSNVDELHQNTPATNYNQISNGQSPSNTEEMFGFTPEATNTGQQANDNAGQTLVNPNIIPITEERLIEIGATNELPLVEPAPNTDMFGFTPVDGTAAQQSDENMDLMLVDPNTNQINEAPPAEVGSPNDFNSEPEPEPEPGQLENSDIPNVPLNNQIPLPFVTTLPLEAKFSPRNAQSARISDIPFFWYIPRSGAEHVQKAMLDCYSLTAAAGYGGKGKHLKDKFLMTFTEEDGRKYVNVDVTTPAGIQDTIEKHFIGSDLADVVISPLLQEASEIFQSPDYHRGQCFVFMRHPVRRAISLFYFVQYTTGRWEDVTIDEYAQSNEVESNWMVRELSGKLSGGPITTDDFQRAKDFLQINCVIGLTDFMEESIRRFEKFFSWERKNQECLDDIFQNPSIDKTPNYVNFEENSFVWNLMQERNTIDIDLYDYAYKLFIEQTNSFIEEETPEG